MSTALGLFSIREMKLVLRFFQTYSSVKIMEDSHDVYFKHLLTSLEETHGKTIGIWSLFTVKDFHHLKDLILLERSHQRNGPLPPNGIKRVAIKPGLPTLQLDNLAVIELHNVFSDPSLI